MSASNDITSKVCRKCGVEKLSSEFYSSKQNLDGLQSYCKLCAHAGVSAWTKAHPEKVAAQKAAYYAANREKVAAQKAAYRAANLEKEAARHAAWCETNREKRTAYQAAYRKANPEKVAAYRAAYRAANPEKVAATQAAYFKANSEKIAVYQAAYRAANPDKVAAASAAWQKANPEQNAANARNYRARKNSAPGSHTAEDVQTQYERQKGKCYWCNCRLEDYHVDHVVPLVEGGSNWPVNLVIACPTCNTSKNAKHPMDFAGVMF